MSPPPVSGRDPDADRVFFSLLILTTPSTPPPPSLHTVMTGTGERVMSCIITSSSSSYFGFYINSGYIIYVPSIFFLTKCLLLSLHHTYIYSYVTNEQSNGLSTSISFYSTSPYCVSSYFYFRIIYFCHICPSSSCFPYCS